MKKVLFVLFLSTVSLLFFGEARPSDFPNRPITLVVPFQVGGATDVVMRPLAEAAKKYLGQPVIVENRPGGGSAVGVGSIIGKKPDGYLIAAGSPAFHRASFINKLSFDTVNDVTPVIGVAGFLYGIVVKSDSPFKNLKDLLEYAKANPGALKYMASGVGSGGHVAMEQLAHHAGVRLLHMPSRGDAESVSALLGGRVDLNSTPSGWVPLLEEGKLRLLATYGSKRNESFPNTPTVLELGYKVVEETPIGILGPKGMPPEVVRILHDGFRKACGDPMYIATMKKFAMPVLYQNTEDYTAYWRKDYVDEEEIVKKYIKSN